MSPSSLSRLILTLLLLALAGCAKHQLYRDDLSLCPSPDPERVCAHNALQQVALEGSEEAAYLLGFIEFDDQGQLFSRDQMWAVTGELNRLAGTRDLLMVVFVHGWKHSAAPLDGNIATLRETLRRLAQLEAHLARVEGRKPRLVSGVYLGWRGGSVELPLVKELSFWERKNTAHKVGHGAVTEVLNRLELIRNTRNHLAAEETDRADTRLVVVGHSFGGAVVYSSLSQILMNRFVDTLGPDGVVSDVVGFGDLVVLINPAFEAARFTPLSDMANERRSYFESQLPVMAILTSEADLATKYAFPIGRGLSTLFETHRQTERLDPLTREPVAINQRSANITAVGHFAPYRTHTLRAEPQAPGSDAPSVRATLQRFRAVSAGWDSDQPGGRIPFDGSVLARGTDSVSKNPYLVIAVDKELIGDHNDLEDPRIFAFVRQLILLSSQHSDPAARRQLRELLSE